MNMVLAQHLLDTYLQQLEIDADSAVEIPLSLRLVDAPMGDEPILHIDQALAEGKAEVRELNPPTVSRLEVCNLSEFRVLVPPFALLQGGGQNRTVIKPAVLEPHSSATIEVHCVPMGRWNPRAGGTFARSRSAPMGFKRRSMKHYYSGGHPARGSAFNQSATWERVASSLDACGTRSRTSDLMEEVESYRPIEVPDRLHASGLLSQVAEAGWALEGSSKSAVAGAVRKALAASLGSLRTSQSAPPAGAALDERFHETRDALLEHGRWELHQVTGCWHAVLATNPHLPNLSGQAVVDDTGVLWLSLQDAPELPDEDPRRARRRRRRASLDRHELLERVEAAVREVRSLLAEGILEAYPEPRHVRDVVRYLNDRRAVWPGPDEEHAPRVSRRDVRRIAFDQAHRRMNEHSR